MNLFFDTSALIKKYIIEEGSENVDYLMNNANMIFISVITEIETFSTFKRLLLENAITQKEYKILIKEFQIDYEYYSQIDFDSFISLNAKSMIEKYQLKSLDSIQLGTALSIKDEIDYFVVTDNKIIKSAKKEGFKILNPIV